MKRNQGGFIVGILVLFLGILLIGGALAMAFLSFLMPLLMGLMSVRLMCLAGGVIWLAHIYAEQKGEGAHYINWWVFGTGRFDYPVSNRHNRFSQIGRAHV